MIAYLAALIAITGLMLYAFAGNAKLCEIGRILFFCGMFVFTAQLGARTVHLLP